MPRKKRSEPFRYDLKPRRRSELASREYKVFKEEEIKASLPRTLFEKACRVAPKILNIEPDKKTGKAIQDAINFSHLKIAPNGVASLTILFTFFTCFPALILMITHSYFELPGLRMGHALLIIFLSLPFSYYLYTYPFRIKRMYEMEAGSEAVTMVLYISMYMRNIPNLEGAVRFTSENMKGRMGNELRKLVWDLDVGNYLTIQQALMDYGDKWKKNKNFTEAVEIVMASMQQPNERRTDMLDEAVTVILDGNRENAKHFNQSLRTPITAVHAMGIILPVMGLVMFPLVAIFLGIEASVLFIGYDIVLPIALFFIILHIMEKRPSTFSKIDVKVHPNVPPEGKFLIGNKAVSAWPLPLILCIVGIALGIVVFYLGINEVVAAVIITGSIAFSIGLYFKLISYQRMQLREDVMAIENEFTEALFQLGNQIASGIPIELSLDHNVKRISNLKIKQMFKKALNNMKTMGMTFAQAFFDKEYGAIRYYPSALVNTVMRTVTEAAKKGMKTASVTMVSISRYLKNIHKTQEEIKDMLSETLSSMRFQAFFLSPIISGVVATLAIVMMEIMNSLATSLEGMPIDLGFMSALSETSITPFQFILVVAIYMIETCIILAIFINGVENGEDPIGRNDSIANTLIIGFTIFILVLFVTLMIFMPLVQVVTP